MTALAGLQLVQVAAPVVESEVQQGLEDQQVQSALLAHKVLKVFLAPSVPQVPIQPCRVLVAPLVHKASKEIKAYPVLPVHKAYPARMV
jgi:hypothetical protein